MDVSVPKQLLLCKYELSQRPTRPGSSRFSSQRRCRPMTVSSSRQNGKSCNNYKHSSYKSLSEQRPNTVGRPNTVHRISRKTEHVRSRGIRTPNRKVRQIINDEKIIKDIKSTLKRGIHASKFDNRVEDALIPEDAREYANQFIFCTHSVDETYKHCKILANQAVFPSGKAKVSRHETVKLHETLRKLVNKIPNSSEEICEQLQQTFKQRYDKTSGSFEPILQNLKNLEEIMQEEHAVYYICLHELARQLKLECKEKGNLLTYLREKYAELFKRSTNMGMLVYEEMTKLHREWLRQTLIERKDMKNVTEAMKEKVKSLEEEVKTFKTNFSESYKCNCNEKDTSGVLSADQESMLAERRRTILKGGIHMVKTLRSCLPEKSENDEEEPEENNKEKSQQQDKGKTISGWTVQNQEEKEKPIVEFNSETPVKAEGMGQETGDNSEKLEITAPTDLMNTPRKGGVVAETGRFEVMIAACRIQSLLRGYRDRKEALMKRLEALQEEIQSKRVSAAIKLQKIFRGSQERKKEKLQKLRRMKLMRRTLYLPGASWSVIKPNKDFENMNQGESKRRISRLNRRTSHLNFGVLVPQKNENATNENTRIPTFEQHEKDDLSDDEDDIGAPTEKENPSKRVRLLRETDTEVVLERSDSLTWVSPAASTGMRKQIYRRKKSKLMKEFFVNPRRPREEHLAAAKLQSVARMFAIYKRKRQSSLNTDQKSDTEVEEIPKSHSKASSVLALLKTEHEYKGALKLVLGDVSVTLERIETTIKKAISDLKADENQELSDLIHDLIDKNKDAETSQEKIIQRRCHNVEQKLLEFLTLSMKLSFNKSEGEENAEEKKQTDAKKKQKGKKTKQSRIGKDKRSVLRIRLEDIARSEREENLLMKCQELEEKLHLLQATLPVGGRKEDFDQEYDIALVKTEETENWNVPTNPFSASNKSRSFWSDEDGVNSDINTQENATVLKIPSDNNPVDASILVTKGKQPTSKNPTCNETKMYSKNTVPENEQIMKQKVEVSTRSNEEMTEIQETKNEYDPVQGFTKNSERVPKDSDPTLIPSNAQQTDLVTGEHTLNIESKNDGSNEVYQQKHDAGSRYTVASSMRTETDELQKTETPSNTSTDVGVKPGKNEQNLICQTQKEVSDKAPKQSHSVELTNTDSSKSESEQTEVNDKNSPKESITKASEGSITSNLNAIVVEKQTEAAVESESTESDKVLNSLALKNLEADPTQSINNHGTQISPESSPGNTQKTIKFDTEMSDNVSPSKQTANTWNNTESGSAMDKSSKIITEEHKTIVPKDTTVQSGIVVIPRIDSKDTPPTLDPAQIPSYKNKYPRSHKKAESKDFCSYYEKKPVPNFTNLKISGRLMLFLTEQCDIATLERKIKPKPLPWLLLFIRKCYNEMMTDYAIEEDNEQSSKMKKDKLDDLRRKHTVALMEGFSNILKGDMMKKQKSIKVVETSRNNSDQNRKPIDRQQSNSRRKAVAEFIVEQLLAKYGLRSFLDKKLCELMLTINAYKTCHREVSLFSEYVEQLRTPQQLRLHLKARYLCQKNYTLTLFQKKDISEEVVNLSSACEIARELLETEEQKDEYLYASLDRNALKEHDEKEMVKFFDRLENRCMKKKYEENLIEFSLFTEMLIIRAGELWIQTQHRMWAYDAFFLLDKKGNGTVDLASFMETFTKTKPSKPARILESLYYNLTKNSGTEAMTYATFLAATRIILMTDSTNLVLPPLRLLSTGGRAVSEPTVTEKQPNNSIDTISELWAARQEQIFQCIDKLYKSKNSADVDLACELDHYKLQLENTFTINALSKDEEIDYKDKRHLIIGTTSKGFSVVRAYKYILSRLVGHSWDSSENEETSLDDAEVITEEKESLHLLESLLPCV